MPLNPVNIVDTDFAVVGGGLVGMAVAWGLLRAGRSVTVCDEGDVAFRASRGNFGLVWTQGKGATLPDYSRWSRRSASLWPALADELRDLTGHDTELSQPGGLDFCLSEAEAEATVARLEGLRTAMDGDYPYEYLGANALRELVPEVGPGVVGATWFPEDGHVNPLYLLRSLIDAFVLRGGQLLNGAPVDTIEPNAGGFTVSAGRRVVGAGQVVLAAGLGNARLGPMVGLDVPVRPVRGQVLITERVQTRLKLPSVQIRQVGEGAIQIGDSKEEVGLDDGTDGNVIAAIARRAVHIYPFLEHVRTVRAWSALRVMSPDGYPVYERSAAHPGASVVTCHSGVTLAAAHALELAPWIAGDRELPLVRAFSSERLHATTRG